MKYLISLGSNIGEKEQNIKKAIDLLKLKGTDITGVSPNYLTSPVDYLPQDDFVNACAVAESDLPPDLFYKQIASVESEMGRIKLIDKGPRNIDIDIIFWEGGAFDNAGVSVPHPRWQERLFVMMPALDIIDKTGVFSRYAIEISDILLKSNDSLNNQSIRKI